MQQMYLLACLLGAALQAALLTQGASILALMGAGPNTLLFSDASAYLKVGFRCIGFCGAFFTQACALLRSYE